MDAGNPLSKVLFDNISGSSEILNRVLSVLLEIEDAEGDWKINANEILVYGLKEFGQFQVVMHFLHTLESEFPKFSTPSDLRSWINNYKLNWSDLPEKWVNVLKGILTDNKYTISTHSQSESLKAVLRKLAKTGYELKIVQSQSGPVNEGELQANWLVNKGLDVVLVSDALSTGFVEKSDLVLLGCDGIYTDGFINKAGSLALCLAASAYKKPVYVLADSRKISDRKAPEEKPKPSTELSSRTHPNLEVLNLYFERVPHKWVTGYVTEKGILEENI